MMSFVITIVPADDATPWCWYIRGHDEDQVLGPRMFVGYLPDT